MRNCNFLCRDMNVFNVYLYVSRLVIDELNIYIYIIVEKSPNSGHLYDHGFMDKTNRFDYSIFTKSSNSYTYDCQWKVPRLRLYKMRILKYYVENKPLFEA